MKIKFEVKHGAAYTIIAFQAATNLDFGILKELKPPDPVAEEFAHRGLVLSGKGPIWLYGFLVHFYHTTQYIGIHDPRLKGAVVVESHVEGIEPGDLLPL